jgi:UDP-glucose 4-epimerase
MRVLATGQGGYIAQNLKRLLEESGASCDLRSVRGTLPDMRGYGAVVHLAAIVHDSKASLEACRRINRDLALDLARKAKEDGVRRLVFMSTMAVYGLEGRLRGPMEIGPRTAPSPKTPYGISKWEAEEGLRPLADESFKISVLRPPMVYGEGCPGNYARLRKLVEALPVFPDVDNQRSMIEVGNLCAFVRDLLEASQDAPCAVYLPQDPSPRSASEMARSVKPGVRLSKALGFFAQRIPLAPFVKLFGSLTYAPETMPRLKRPLEAGKA